MSNQQPNNEKWWRNYVANLFKSAAVKAALNFIKSKFGLVLAGPWGWLANLVLEKLWDYFGAPMVRWAQRKLLLGVDKATGKIKVRKVKDAKEAGNVADYDSAIDDLFE